MSVNFDFSAKNVWVTGAGRGIGYAIALAFHEAGAKVVGLDVQFGSDTSKYPFKTESLNIANNEEVKRTAKNLLAEEPVLDVLVNAAGVLKTGATDELSFQNWQQCFDVNVTGSFNLFQSTMPVFRSQKFGAIITLASNSAHAPRIGMSAYGASKAALRSLCQSVGLEMAGYGVRCNIVSPGSTDTEMLRGMWASPDQGIAQTIKGYPDQFKLGIPLQKIGKPEEVASAALYLASDAASHIILQDIVVDGGATLGA